MIVAQNEGLQYFGSANIVAFLKANPLSWPDSKFTSLGASGDRMPPSTASYEFLRLLNRGQSLFSQSEYWEECTSIWSVWLSKLTPQERVGFRAKVFRNFYPSFMDQLHVWSLFVEAHWFDMCRLDAVTDTLGKHDLIVSLRGNPPIAIHLTTNSTLAHQANEHKRLHRPAQISTDYQIYSIELPVAIGPGQRPKDYPENKRWFCLKDFEKVYTEYVVKHSLWESALIPCTCGHHHKGRRTA